MLTDRVVLPDPDLESPEDILSSSAATVFTDDLRTEHGNEGSSLVYRSPRYGDLTLRLADPARHDERLLFGHYLWNAALLLATLIEDGHLLHDRDVHDDYRACYVQGHSVIELGAGTGLCGIVSLLAGGRQVDVTDYPADSLLSAIRANVEGNISVLDQGRISVVGHEWGDVSTAFAQQHRSKYSRVLLADCLWISHQHDSLARSMSYFLTTGKAAARTAEEKAMADGDAKGEIEAETEAEKCSERETRGKPMPEAQAWVVAGFHTGRAVVAAFFETAEAHGLVVHRRWERHADGSERDWDVTRQEDIGERRKWCVVAVLRATGSQQEK